MMTPQIKYYMPTTDRGKADFLDNLAVKLPGHAATLGVDPGEITRIVEAAAMFNYVLDAQEAFKTFKQDLSAYKNMLRDGEGAGIPPITAFPVAPTLPVVPTLVKKGIFFSVREIVTRIKANSNYTTNIGEDLGIVGDEETVEINKLKPVLTSEMVTGHPVIKWTKGHADALDIYVDRNDGAGFVFLATDSQPDYTDTTPLPQGVDSAVWEYQAIYKIADEQVGKYSESIKVTMTKKAGN